MSDLNDLIHTNARNAFDQGVKTERERILKFLEDDARYSFGDVHHYIADVIALIKEEQR
jgi:ABC-type microcin C transport system permease subunit YejB